MEIAEQSTEIKRLIEAIGQADSAENMLEVVEALADIRQEAAIPTLIKVLGYNNPGAAVAAVEGLIALGNAAVPALLELIDGYNYGARAWSIRALAGIGNPHGLQLLLDAAINDFSLSVRRASARGLGGIAWGELNNESVVEGQTKVCRTLIQVLEDSEWVVRYAAVVGLERFILSVEENRNDYLTQIQAAFQQLLEEEPELVVITRVKLAISRV